MSKINFLNRSRDIIFTSLYYKLGFEEVKKGLFIKKYSCGEEIKIKAYEQEISFKYVNIINGKFKLNKHVNFVILELVDRLLNLDYQPQSIIIDLDNEYHIYVKNMYIKCFEWGTLELPEKINISDKYMSIYYESRLISGLVENNYYCDFKGKRWDLGVFESKYTEIKLYNKSKIVSNDYFIYDGSTLVKYIGNDEIVRIPDGTLYLSSGIFWDNQTIKEVIFPDGILNIGGDTFYNCSNLEKVVIPSSVIEMGDNPFAGCPKLKLVNKSPNFIYEKGALYNEEKTVLIYYSISSKTKEFFIPNTVKLINKHAFYMSNLEKIIIPESVNRLANNPFSAASKLHIENHSNNYKIIDDVIYSTDLKNVIGALNSIDTDCLVLQDAEEINKNSFFNCIGLRKIVLPKTLKKIGYNPFVGCKNLHVENHSKEFEVSDEVLFNKDKTKLIFCPAWNAVGEVEIPESVNILERGAFSFCDKLEKINLKNVNIINKSAFTNCKSLKSVYCSDFVQYIGEWAFAHCDNLKEVSVFKNTQVDNNAFMNTKANVIIRKERSNYLIQSENLYTLRSILPTLKEKIDCITIDPPYNTHIDYIGYKDGDYDNGYNEFMRKRIELSHGLLSNKGFLVIYIDEQEVDNLVKICSKYFDKKLIEVHRWKKKHPAFDQNRVVLNKNKKQVDYEYIIFCRKSKLAKFNNLMQPVFVNDKLVDILSPVPETFNCFGTTSSAKDEIEKVFGDRNYFSTPKPVKLIKEIIRATTDENSIILDFFAGSGTTGVAVDELNKEKPYNNRKFILVTNNESNICEKVTKVRLDRSSIKYYFN